MTPLADEAARLCPTTSPPVPTAGSGWRWCRDRNAVAERLAPRAPMHPQADVAAATTAAAQARSRSVWVVAFDPDDGRRGRRPAPPSTPEFGSSHRRGARRHGELWLGRSEDRPSHGRTCDRGICSLALRTLQVTSVPPPHSHSVAPGNRAADRLLCVTHGDLSIPVAARHRAWQRPLHAVTAHRPAGRLANAEPNGPPTPARTRSHAAGRRLVGGAAPPATRRCRWRCRPSRSAATRWAAAA